MMAMATETAGGTSKDMRRNKSKGQLMLGGTNKDGCMLQVMATAISTVTTTVMATMATMIGGRMHKDSGRNKNRGQLTRRNNKEGRMLQAMAAAIMAPTLATAMTMIITMATTIGGGIHKDMERTKTGGQHMWMDSKSGQFHLRAMGIIVAMQMVGFWDGARAMTIRMVTTIGGRTHKARPILRRCTVMVIFELKF